MGYRSIQTTLIYPEFVPDLQGSIGRILWDEGK